MIASLSVEDRRAGPDSPGAAEEDDPGPTSGKDCLKASYSSSSGF